MSENGWPDSLSCLMSVVSAELERTQAEIAKNGAAAGEQQNLPAICKVEPDAQISEEEISVDDDSSTTNSQQSVVNSPDCLPELSRKEKSLGILCKNFLLCVGEEASKGNEIHLEEISQKLQVEKRRVYDIVNVMEALEAMTRRCKSYYSWDGLAHLPQLMAQLQAEAQDENLQERIREVEQAMYNFTDLSRTDKSKKTTLATEIVGSTIPDEKGVGPDWGDEDTPNSSQGSVTGASFRQRNNKQSLSQMCRRFLMVLLCNLDGNKRISLDVASTVLMKDSEGKDFEPPSRSRCRRLYDIANVLVAMGLIKKVHYLFGTKKIPLFVYSGPKPDINGRIDRNDGSLPFPTETVDPTPSRQRNYVGGCARHRPLDLSLLNRSRSDRGRRVHTPSLSQPTLTRKVSAPISPNENLNPQSLIKSVPRSVNLDYSGKRMMMTTPKQQYLMKIGANSGSGHVPTMGQGQIPLVKRSAVSEGIFSLGGPPGIKRAKSFPINSQLSVSQLTPFQPHYGRTETQTQTTRVFLNGGQSFLAKLPQPSLQTFAPKRTPGLFQPINLTHGRTLISLSEKQESRKD